MIPKSILVFLFSCVMATAIAQKPVQVILPKTEFDIKQASEMLNEGNSEIKGVAYYEDRAPIGIKVGETIYARLGIVVTLYPVTAYMEEYLELKKRISRINGWLAFQRWPTATGLKRKFMAPRVSLFSKG